MPSVRSRTLIWPRSDTGNRDCQVAKDLFGIFLFAAGGVGKKGRKEERKKGRKGEREKGRRGRSGVREANRRRHGARNAPRIQDFRAPPIQRLKSYIDHKGGRGVIGPHAFSKCAKKCLVPFHTEPKPGQGRKGEREKQFALTPCPSPKGRGEKGDKFPAPLPSCRRPCCARCPQAGEESFH